MWTILIVWRQTEQVVSLANFVCVIYITYNIARQWIFLSCSFQSKSSLSLPLSLFLSLWCSILTGMLLTSWYLSGSLFASHHITILSFQMLQLSMSWSFSRLSSHHSFWAPHSRFIEVASVCLESLAHIYNTSMTVLTLIRYSCMSDVPSSVIEILIVIMRKQFTSESKCCCIILL